MVFVFNVKKALSSTFDFQKKLFKVESIFVNSPKKILSVHGAYSEQVETIHSKTLGSLASKVEPNAFNLSDKLTTASKAVQKYYKDKANVNFIYLPAPLDIEKFRDINEIEKKITSKTFYL